MLRSLIRLALAAAAATLSLPSTLFALNLPPPPPPGTWTRTTGNGKFILVVHDAIWPDGKYPNFEGYRGNDAAPLKSKYPVSGMYRDTHPPKLMWRAIQSCSPWDEFASDGIHIVKCSHFFEDRSEVKLILLKEGLVVRQWSAKQLSTPNIVELSPIIRLFCTHRPYFRWLKESAMNDERLTFSLVTAEDNRFVFDLRTGELIENPDGWDTERTDIPVNDGQRESPWKVRIAWPTGPAIVAGILLVLIIFLFVTRRRRSTGPSA